MRDASIVSRRSLLSRTAPAGLNIVWDGNSITEGQPASYAGGFPKFLRDTQYPFQSCGYANVGIGGQTTQQMLSTLTDVTAAFVPGSVNILCCMEGTNQNSSGSPDPTFSLNLLRSYVVAARAAANWTAVVVGIPPPCYLGDQLTQGDTDTWNARLDVYCSLLRREWPSFADGLVDLRAAGPFAQSRYPNYLRATFYSTTLVDGYSNNSTFIVEGGGTPGQRIHPSLEGIRLIAPMWGDAIRRLV